MAIEAETATFSPPNETPLASLLRPRI